MHGTEKEFFNIWEEVSDECFSQYGMKTGNNAKFVAGTIFRETDKNDFFAYAECGVYRGTTFLPIYHLCEKIFKDFTMDAIDSFSGFPEETVLNENDEFEKFEILFREGRINKDHLEMARERCTKLLKKEHLQKEYFVDYEHGFRDKCNRKDEINIVKCSFSDLETNVIGGRDRYDLVFLDCDLYLSYRYCLDFFKNITVILIFDEYYSLKYPGARIACDEFVERNPSWEFFNKIESRPYFERWGIKKKD